jgi:hypothetical protein
MIAKLPSDDENSRAAATAVRAYEIEVNVYRQLQPRLSIRMPRCHHASLDIDAGDFLLLLEDVAPAQQGDQLAGCTADDAAAAVAELPGMHAPLWGDPSLEKLDWLHRNTDESRGFLRMLVQSLHPAFVERYGDRLPDEVVQLSARVVERLDVVEATRARPWTVTHGDFRLDNLLFGHPDRRVVVVDWQTSVHGPGPADLSYFLGGSLSVAERRAHETDLVRDYRHRMRAAGVDLDWDELWTGYRRYSVGGLVMAIAASMLVKRTPRGDDMFMAMAERAAQHALDLEALELLA